MGIIKDIKDVKEAKKLLKEKNPFLFIILAAIKWAVVLFVAFWVILIFILIAKSVIDWFIDINI